MKKMFSGKLLVVFVSSLLMLTTYSIIRACAGGDWFLEDESSSFAPECFVSDSTYYPFFYSDWFYYKLNYDTNHNERFSEVNLKEWSQYLNNTTDTATLRYFMYKASEQALGLTQSWVNGSRRALPDSLRGHVRHLAQGNIRLKVFFKYLKLARQAEAYAYCYHNEYWDYEQKALPAEAKIRPLLDALNSEFQSAQQAFVKERYWFQLVRYYYFFKPAKAVEFFEANKKKFEHDCMYYRTLAYVAGALSKTKNTAKANYYFSQVFDGCPMLRTVAHQGFNPRENNDWNRTLSYCQTPEERITLWQMLGICFQDGIRAMKEIYQINSESPKMDVLLTRYVNMVEAGPLWYDNKADSLRHTMKEKDFQWVCSVANEAKVSNLFLWNVSAGYLCFLNKKYAEANRYYQLALGKIDRKNQLAIAQMRLLTMLNKIASLDVIRHDDENALLPDLKWLFDNKNKDELLRTNHAREWVCITMSQKYAAQHDGPKSECFHSTKAYFADQGNVEQYKYFFEKKTDTDYDAFCKSISAISLADLYYFQAISEVYADRDLNKALAWLKNSKLYTMPGNPFNGRLNDCHDCDHEAAQKVKYDSYSLVAKIAEMENALKTGVDVYNNALLLGNVFYNMSFYGNSRAFYECEIVGGGCEPLTIDYHFRPMITDNKVAYQYYKKALAAAQNNEQRAKCLFLMSKCERNEWYNKTYYFYTDNEYHDTSENKNPDFVKWESFGNLSQFADTHYYQLAIKECGYFRAIMQKEGNDFKLKQ